VSVNESKEILAGFNKAGLRICQPMKIAEQTWPEGTVPIVSICCTTYNHEKFIRKCLDGFLMQETTFPVEVLINDDASTDRTADIIREYENNYPHIIRPIYQVENQYSKGKKPNPSFNYPRSNGKYIALCEGDDYWIHPQKLLKQIYFLEANDDYSICFHNAKILNNGNLVDNYLKKIGPDTTNITDLAKDNYIYTASSLVRNYYSKGLPGYFESCQVGDYPFLLFAAQTGKIKFIDECMSVYRIHEGGVWSTKTTIEKLESSAAIFKHLMNNFNSEVNSILKDRHIELLNKVIEEYKKLATKKQAAGNDLYTPYSIYNNAAFSTILKALAIKIKAYLFGA